MSVRRWQIPSVVVASAATAQSDSVTTAERFRDLATGQPVGANTLLAIVADAEQGSVPDIISEWARQSYQRIVGSETAQAEAVLAAAGFGADTPAYGILDSDYDGERVVAVVRRSPLGLEEWRADGWQLSTVPEPVGMRYAELGGAVLADALGAVGGGGSLILHPSIPRAFVPQRLATVLAAVDLTKDDPAGTDTGTSVYAVTDPLDTTAVVVLFHVAPGPTISVRRTGKWEPDDGTLLGQLRSIDPPPVISISSDQVVPVMRQVDDYDATHPQVAAHPTGGMANQAVAASAGPSPKVAGLCVQADDTGRVLMIQRANDPQDPAGGMWEFPGGHLEDDEDPDQAAQREWEEETGHKLPDGPLDPESPNWDSPNGVYRGYVHNVPTESSVDFAGRDQVTNPDDPDGDEIEAIAWWDPTTLKGNPVVRPELSHTAHLVHTALDPSALAASAQTELEQAVTDAKKADSAFDAERAELDLLEGRRRREFEESVGHRYSQLTSDGVDESEATTVVAREVQAENDRRELWERDRFDTLEAEKARRLANHPPLHDAASRAAAEQRAVVADAAPHTAMPPQLVKYWVAGPGAAKIRWGVRGDWKRAVRHLMKYMDPYRARAAANELHKIATGRWTGSRANKIAEP